MSNYVTAAYPPHAMQRGRAWEQQNKMPVLARVFEQSMDPKACKNCCGSGVVYLSFCSEYLFDTPRIIAQSKAVGEKNERKTSYKPLTYFAGNEKWRKGWYAVESTAAFDCPRCGGKGT